MLSRMSTVLTVQCLNYNSLFYPIVFSSSIVKDEKKKTHEDSGMSLCVHDGNLLDVLAYGVLIVINETHTMNIQETSDRSCITFGRLCNLEIAVSHVHFSPEYGLPKSIVRSRQPMPAYGT